MLLKEIIASLEQLAPPSLQESYDNSGLLVGDPSMEVNAALICLDSTPEVIREAIDRGCNLVVAHHPIIFSGLKKINGKTYIERAVMMAIRHDIAIYAIHTNLDNVRAGVNQRIADKLGLLNTRILEPKAGILRKVVVFVPPDHAQAVRNAIFEAGGGHIGNYDECSFNSVGEGTFRGSADTQPYVGKQGERHTEHETRIEVIVPEWLTHRVMTAIRQAHPYEEVATDIYPLSNALPEVGSGMIGELPAPMDAMDFLKLLKQTMQAGCVRYTALPGSQVRKIAVCGGSGSFMLPAAIRSGADVLVTADFKYHQFFDADGRIVVADIGHFESEQFTIGLLGDWFKAKFPTFATHFTGLNTNPVNYL